MKLGDARVFSVPTFSSDTAPRASTLLDRWVVGRIRQHVPSARLRFVLWDGFELPYDGDDPSIGTIVFRNRRRASSGAFMRNTVLRFQAVWKCLHMAPRNRLENLW